VVELGVTVKASGTGPGPAPLPPEVICIHPGPATVLYVQPAGVVTFTEPVPPAEAISTLEESSDTVQAIPVCVTAKSSPATVAWSTGGDVLPVAGIVSVTLAEPAPEAGVALRPDAVHGHPATEEVMFTVAVPPAAVAVAVPGLMPNEHVEPNCVMV
jgi:hypothetical protein